ncbi:MAG: MFS transporter [Clostridiales bacterium]|nr:MFS transporter [Clostridiales bacterium]
MTDKTEKNAILFVTIFGNFVMPFLASALNIALPSIGKSFQVDGVSLNWVATAYLLAISVVILPFGKISDIYGRKKMYFIGMLLAAVTTVLCAVAPTFPLFIIARVAQGISVGMTLGIGPAMLSAAFPPESRGKVLGIVTASVYIGSSVGPLIGGVLVQNFGWKSVLWTVAPMFLVVSVMTVALVRTDWVSDKKIRFDFAGAVLYAVGMVMLIYGVSEVPKPSATVFSIAGVVILTVFIAFEMRTRDAILDLSLFKGNRVFIFSNLATLINYSSVSAIGYLLSLKLQYFHGMSPFHAGLILFIQPLIQAIFSPFAGRLSDKIHPRKVASFGMAISCSGIILLIVESIRPATWLIVVSLIVLGFGFAVFAAPNTNAIMGTVDRRHFGVASSMIATMRTIGQVFSMGIVMFVFSLVIGRVKISSDVYDKFSQSLLAIFIIMTCFSLAGIFASLVKNKKTAAADETQG